MRIALYHGFDFAATSAGQHTSHLARTLARQGHDVHVLCCDRTPAAHEFFNRGFEYDPRARRVEIFARRSPLRGTATLHRLPLPALPPPDPGATWIESFLGLGEVDRRAYLELASTLVRNILQRFRPEVLHVDHLAYEAGVAVAACAAAAIPCVVFPHEASIGHRLRRDPRWRAGTASALASCDAVLCGNTSMFRTVAGIYPQLQTDLEAKLHFVGSGVETTPCGSGPQERGAAWRALRALPSAGGKARYHSLGLLAALDQGEIEAVQRYWNAYDHTSADDALVATLDRIPGNAEIILYAGDLTAVEGVHTAIAALPSILARRSQAHLLIAGAGSYREVLEGFVHALATGNQTLYSALAIRGGDLDREGRTGPLHDLLAHASHQRQRRELFARANEIARHVHFLGSIDGVHRRSLLQQAAVVLLPSLLPDPFLGRLLECFACGVAPVATFAGGLRDGLEEVRSDLPPEIWLRMQIPVEPETRVADLADRVVDWLEDRGRAGVGERLRGLAVQRFDWNLVARRTLEAYESTITRYTAAAGAPDRPKAPVA